MATGKKSYISLAVFGLLIAVAVTYWSWGRGSGAGFPWVEQGAYVGTLSGFRPGDPHASAVLYVERLAHGDAALVVPLIEGHEPQLVSVREQVAGGTKLLEPIHLKLLQQDVSLVGSSRFGRLSGVIEASNHAPVGKWELRKIATEDLVEGIDEIKSKLADVDRWLNARSKFLELDHSYSRLMASLTESQEKTTKLQALLAQQDVLRSRADSRKVTLKKEIEQIGSEQHNKEENLQNLVSELDLLTRITKRGKVISLARKVSNRENSWYLANWRAAEDSGGLEEFLVGSEAVDLAAVEKQLVKAREKESLLRELNGERRRIAELEARLRDPKRQDTKPPASDQEERIVPQKPVEPKRGFWDRIFG